MESFGFRSPIVGFHRIQNDLPVVIFKRFVYQQVLSNFLLSGSISALHFLIDYYAPDFSPSLREPLPQI